MKISGKAIHGGFVIALLVAGLSFLSGCASKQASATLEISHLRPPPEVRIDRPALEKSLPTKPEPKPRLTPGEEVVRVALSQLGGKYRWGGIRPETGFDCSGLIQWSYAKLGVELPRKSTQMFKAFRPVEAEDIQPGDLIFYKTRRGPTLHVALYAGNSTIIHAARRGEGVRQSSMLTPYWTKRFKGARRVEDLDI